MENGNFYIVGCIPTPQITESIKSHFFASVHSHIQTILEFSGSSTNNDPLYDAHCYYMLTNMSENHEDTWLILKRCLTIDDYKHSCLLIIGKAYSALLESIDNKQIVRNIFFPK